jgi:pyrroline-5-carboxylate reductase
MSFIDLSSKTVGFLGCGKISSALCRGFGSLSANSISRPKRIIVSLRNRDKSQALANQFPELVLVEEDNSILVSQCDIIFIGLLPVVARAELPNLPFRSNQLIISMMAAIDFNETVSLIVKESFKESNIVRTVPLPSSARRTGPILMYPSHENISSVLKVLGTPIVCKDEAEMKPMIALTGHISSFFELMRVNEEFMVDHGIDSRTARDFITSFYSSLATGAEKSEEPLSGMLFMSNIFCLTISYF